MSKTVRRYELAAALNVSEATIAKWVKAGRFPKPLPLGHTHRWRVEDVAHLLGGSQPEAQPDKSASGA
jgi:predicted DNA-binding transcriptional regulator AlpA